jgi:hypothetical protein
VRRDRVEAKVTDRVLPTRVTFGPAVLASGVVMMLTMEVDRHGLEVLDQDECLRLLELAADLSAPRR